MMVNVKDATWHLFDLNPAEHSSQWLRLTEEEFRAASFLDQRLLLVSADQPKGREPLSLPLAKVPLEIEPAPASNAHFIFHLGHCGSTLISRALATTPTVLPLREPLSLRQLASLQPGLPPASQDFPQSETQQQEKMRLLGSEWGGYLKLALAAHSRVFHPGQVSMIKATSTCNALIHPIMTILPRCKSLLLYLPLESYLAGMMGKQSPALDLRGHAPDRLDEWWRLTCSTLQPTESATFTVTELAVLSWLVSMARLSQAQQRFPDRCCLLNFEDFLAAPESRLGTLTDFFGLQESGAEILQAWPEIAVGYSKQPQQPYSAFNRNRTLQRGRLQRAAEIQAGLQWAQHLLREHPALQACSAFMGA